MSYKMEKDIYEENTYNEKTGNLISENNSVINGNLYTEENNEITLNYILEKCEKQIYGSENLSQNSLTFLICDNCSLNEAEYNVLFSSPTCYTDFSPLIVVYLMYGTIFLAAIIGNLLVLYTFASNRKLHTVTNCFIANLAVGDLLTAVFCVPSTVASSIVLQYWPFGSAFCILQSYFQVSTIIVLQLKSCNNFIL